ncbi:MAG: ABC transporter permease, partial [Candidatus Thermoplasmatota archaeon]
MEDLNLYLVAACAAVAIAVLLLGLRQRVLARLGLRNILRRRVRTITIVFGLMIGTATISSAFVVGDTMEYVFTGEVYRELHTIDEIVYLEGADGSWMYYNESAYAAIADLADDERVDGIAPAVIDRGAVFCFETALSEPSVNVLGLTESLEGFGSLRDVSGDVYEIGVLNATSAYLNMDCAEELDVQVGDSILLVFTVPMNLTVAGVVSADGLGGYMGEANIFLPLETVKLHTSGRINAILVSNTGGVEDGAVWSGAVSMLLRERL